MRRRTLPAHSTYPIATDGAACFDTLRWAVGSLPAVLRRNSVENYLWMLRDPIWSAKLRKRFPPMNDPVSIRPAQPTDIPYFVRLQLDPEAAYMAAFVDPAPPDKLAARWRDIFANPDNTVVAVLWSGKLVGSAGTFWREGVRELTYWIERQYWGRGIATSAVAQVVRAEPARPLFARVASDNAGSVRVLEKAGFVRIGKDTGHAAARGCEVDELIFRL